MWWLHQAWGQGFLIKPLGWSWKPHCGISACSSTQPHRRPLSFRFYSLTFWWEAAWGCHLERCETHWIGKHGMETYDLAYSSENNLIDSLASTEEVSIVGLGQETSCFGRPWAGGQPSSQGAYTGIGTKASLHLPLFLSFSLAVSLSLSQSPSLYLKMCMKRAFVAMAPWSMFNNQLLVGKALVCCVCQFLECKYPTVTNFKLPTWYQ